MKGLAAIAYIHCFFSSSTMDYFISIFCAVYSNIVVSFLFLVTSQCSDINNRRLEEIVCGAAKTVGGYLSIQ
jgi:hypothetical protein